MAFAKALPNENISLGAEIENMAILFCVFLLVELVVTAGLNSDKKIRTKN